MGSSCLVISYNNVGESLFWVVIWYAIDERFPSTRRNDKRWRPGKVLFVVWELEVWDEEIGRRCFPSINWAWIRGNALLERLSLWKWLLKDRYLYRPGRFLLLCLHVCPPTNFKTQFHPQGHQKTILPQSDHGCKFLANIERWEGLKKNHQREIAKLKESTTKIGRIIKLKKWNRR